jgi:hypothetical protein
MVKILPLSETFRTFVNMRLILLIGAFLLTLNTFGQRSLKTPYEAHMEAQAISKLCLKLDSFARKGLILTWRPINRVKFTMKTRVNRSVIQKIDINNGFSNAFDELDSDDYWGLAAYDIRCKVYVTKRLRVVNRVLITGIKYNQYFYTTGVILKF